MRIFFLNNTCAYLIFLDTQIYIACTRNMYMQYKKNLSQKQDISHGPDRVNEPLPPLVGEER
jgi:hypothetical protein